jgi:hypothetical protein
MQHADQREQPARGVKVHLDLAGEPLHQELRALVVQPAPPHVDCLDLARHGGANRLIVALADHEVILHDFPERREREHVKDDRRAVGKPDVEGESILGDAEMQRVGSGVMPRRREHVLLQEVVDRDRALVLDIGIGTTDRAFVERDSDETSGGRFIRR